MFQKVYIAFALIFLVACQAVPVTNNEPSTMDPATYSPRRPASLSGDLRARIKFGQDISFQERLRFENFVGGGQCELYQADHPGTTHHILASDVYGLVYQDGFFQLTSAESSGQTKSKLKGIISCEDGKRRRMKFQRDFNMRDLLRAMGAVLTK